MRRTPTVRVALVALACVVAAPSPPAAGDDDPGDLAKCAATIRSSKDPVARFAAVRRMASFPDDSVPDRLARLVREDADPGLRLEAAHALTMTPSDDADGVLIGLIAGGGPREIREALAVTLRDRGVPLARLVSESARRQRDSWERCRLVEAIAAFPAPIAAGELDRIARTAPWPVADAAIRALERHPLRATVLPDLIADVLATADDLDTLVTALDVAERFGDERVAACEPRLRGLSLAAVDAALDVAAAHVAERRALRSGAASGKPARVRDRTDKVVVAHQGRDLQMVWKRVAALFTQSNQKWEDLRVGCEFYLEPNAMRVEYGTTRLPLTRDPRKVDAFFSGLVYQTKRGTGFGMAESLENAFDRSSWRWEAARTVVLYADAAPRSPRRAAIPPAVHRVMDGTLLELWFIGKSDDVPDAVDDVARAGGTPVKVVEPASRDTGTQPAEGASSGTASSDPDGAGPLDRNPDPPPGNHPPGKGGGVK